MKRLAILAMALSAVSGALVAAQVYRWVDEKGVVEYRDTPPPPSAKKFEQRRIGGSTIQTSTLPYSVQQAANNFPVTLWVSNCGAPCDQARAHLARRGIPHTEKDAQAEVEAFQQLTGGTEVPVLYVGSTRIKGYLESEWEAALDVAGYPRTAITVGGKPVAKGVPPAKAGPAALPPVKIYTHPECGTPCDEARSLLSGRGVQYQEVVSDNDAAIAELRRASGDARVPVLTVGQSVVRGFFAPGYHDALDAAGFPIGQKAAKPY